MVSAGFEFVQTPEGEVLRISARGREVLSNAMTNLGTAFSAEEREALRIKGLLLLSTVTPWRRRTCWWRDWLLSTFKQSLKVTNTHRLAHALTRSHNLPCK